MGQSISARLVRVSLLAIALAGFCRAQITTGGITGQVVDATNAPVPGASVTVTDVGTQAARTTTTNEAGEYTFTLLPLGSYTLRAEARGFQTVVRSNIQVLVNETARIDITLQPSTVREVVEVTAEVSALQTETGEVGNVVQHQTVVDLPLNGRNFIQLIALQPGSASTAKTPNGGISYLTSVFGGNYVVHGAPADGTNYLLDGIDMRDAVDSRVGFEITVDAIQEFKFQAMNYSAAFGRGSGGQINIASRSGTNQFHGAGWEYLRNDVLDARNFFDGVKPPYRQNQFGADVGGPIRKDKTFFFLAYEGFRSRKGLSVATAVPTLKQRTGDFTEGAPIFNPLSVDSATGLRASFPGNQIPASLQSTVALKALQTIFPAPTRPGTANNLFTSASQSNDFDQGNARVDQKLTSADSLFGRLTWVRADRGLPFQYSPLGVGTTVWNSPARNAVLGETHVFGPRTVNEFRFGLNRTFQVLDQPIPGAGAALGITGLTGEPRLQGNPRITISGLGNTGTIGNAPNNRVDNQFVWADNFSHLLGSHTLSLGALGERSQSNGGSNPNAHGTFNFNGIFTAQLTPTGTAGGTGNPVADFLLGFPNSSARCCLTGDGFRNYRKTDLGFYFQDDWKVSATLTLNLGLRWEYFAPYTEVTNRLSQPDLSAAPQTVILLAGQNGVPRSVWNPRYNDWGPRVGFAYSIGASRKTVLRGGYGIFYQPEQLITGFSLAGNPPFVDNQSFLSNTRTPQLSLSNAFPAGLGLPSLTFSAVERNFRDPYDQNWNLAIQRDVGFNTVIAVSYIGNKGVALPLAYDWNKPDTPASGAVAAREPIPGLSSVSLRTNAGGSIYHGLEVKAERRLSQDLSFLTSFVWAKCIDNAGLVFTYDGNVGAIRNPADTRANRGLCVADIGRRFAANFLYRIPLGKGAGGYLKALVGGWEATSIITLEDGQPFSAMLPRDNSNTGRLVDTPDVVLGQDPNAGPKTATRWFNVQAFTNPSPLTFGTAGRNIVIGPGTARVDFALHKDFAITERQAVEFRTEFFDIFNRVNFYQPGNNFGTPSFGVIGAAFDPRQIQFSLKYKF